MGAIGSSADNAAAESFNAAFKGETPKSRNAWPNEHETRLEAFRRLARYNTRRRHFRLGQRSPVTYGTDFQPAATTPARAAWVSRTGGRAPCSCGTVARAERREPVRGGR
jgi:hypothetical protein